MVNASKSVGDCPLVSRVLAGETFARALRLYVGQGRRYSVKELARGIGITDRTIEAWLASPGSTDWREPKLHHLLSVAKFLQDAVHVSDWLVLAGFGAFALPDAGPLNTVSAMTTATGAADAVVARLADGDCSADDTRHLRPVGLAMIATGHALARAA